jgi:hypothetical protein
MGDICARLTREQLATLESNWPAFFGRQWQPRPGPQYLLTQRQELHWYGLLTAGQRAQARAGHLLTWRDFLPQQRAELVQRITDPRDRLSLYARYGHADQQVDTRPEALARAAFGLRFEQQPVQYHTDPSGLNPGFHIGDPGDLLREEGALGRTPSRIELGNDTETVATFIYQLPTVSGAELVTQVPVLTSLSGSLEAGSPVAGKQPGPAARVPDAKPQG